MGLMERPAVERLPEGGTYWEHMYDRFYLKAYVPENELEGKVINYTFRSPLLLVFEEKAQGKEEAVAFAKESGLEKIAAETDASVLFIYPTDEGGWHDATQDLYAAIIAEVKMLPDYADGISELHNFHTKNFDGYYIKGAIFRTDIYSFGKSADYVAKNLLKTIRGEYLWGPGEITPAMCSMEGLSVMPEIERKDIGILSIGNPDEVNKAFEECKHLRIKGKANYVEDYKTYVWKFKMWCGNMEIEPNFKELDMKDEFGCVVVKTSSGHQGAYKNTNEHKVGYYSCYNNNLFYQGPVPLLVGFHGGGDSALFFTFVSGWYEIAHRYGFLFVAIDNHQNVTATEAVEVIETLKKRYNIDEKRMYATGFSMGCGKTWDMFEEYPEVFAALAPASALFSVTNNAFSAPLGDRLNKSIPVPFFYSGGEKSHLPELPFQSEDSLERVQYAVGVNRCKKKFDIDYSEKQNWENEIWGKEGDRSERYYDESRDSYLTVHYFDSEDGVCRTAFGSVDEQVHEFRHHSCECAWKFISQFTQENR